MAAIQPIEDIIVPREQFAEYLARYGQSELIEQTAKRLVYQLSGGETVVVTNAATGIRMTRYPSTCNC